MEEKKKSSLFHRIASHTWSYWSCNIVLFILTVVSLGIAIFCGAGTVYLYQNGFLQMSEEEFQKYQETEGSLYWKSLEYEIQQDAEQFRIFVDPTDKLAEDLSQNALTKEEAELAAGHILNLFLEERKSEVSKFCDMFHIKYWIIHRYGRPEGGNASINSFETAWECRCFIKVGSDWQEQYYVRLWSEENDGFIHSISNWAKLTGIWLENRYPCLYLAVSAGVLFLFFLVISSILAGKKGRMSQTILSLFPMELLLGAYVLLTFLAWRWMYNRLFRISEMSDNKELLQVLLVPATVLAIGVFLFLHMIRRLQKKKWYHQTLTYGCFLFLRGIVREWMRMIAELSITWKFFWAYVVICAIEIVTIWMLVEEENQRFLLLGFWIFEKILLLPALMRYGAAIMKLKGAAKELAKGNVEYRLETGEMPKIFQTFGEDLNAIAGSVQTAVEARMKSEHLKTELITNVSHDIKTPLTSIINFSDLIKQEKTDNEKITEYADHLHQQSVRLKKLLEDLMEASKVSTGNVEVHMEPCDIKVLLEQCLGEFEPRLREKSLELVVKQSEERLQIMADNRMLWRVFENLMNNICKYAQKDTRVYLNAESVTEGKQEWVEITFKNVSKFALDIPPQELMERFVRGDLSRHSEGSGLGLSIVSSLMELQGGNLTLATDGDLFKAILRFPK